MRARQGPDRTHAQKQLPFMRDAPVNCGNFDSTINIQLYSYTVNAPIYLALNKRIRNAVKAYWAAMFARAAVRIGAQVESTL